MNGRWDCCVSRGGARSQYRASGNDGDLYPPPPPLMLTATTLLSVEKDYDACTQAFPIALHPFCVISPSTPAA